jgi:CHAD domain-containing protein
MNTFALKGRAERKALRIAKAEKRTSAARQERTIPMPRVTQSLQRLQDCLQKDSQHFLDSWKAARSRLDESAVHDLRVAARRFVASLFLLQAVTESKSAGRLRRRLKRLVRNFGLLRDLQVHKSILKEAHGPDVPIAFTSHLYFLENQARQDARRYLTDERQLELQDSIRKVHERAERQLPLIPNREVQSRIRSALNVQREKYHAAERSDYSAHPDRLHALRVSARKLRYGLEAARSVVNIPAALELRRLRRQQSELGHDHDLQVARERYGAWKKTQD